MTPDVFVLRIVKEGLGLDDLRVFLSGEDVLQPNDDGLFVIVGLGQATTVGMSHRLMDEEEEQHIYISSAITIDLFSKNRQAIDRMHEVPLSITSDFSKRLGELEKMEAFNEGSILDISEVEGKGTIHRYRFNVIVRSVQNKKTMIPTYEIIKEKITNG